MFIKRNECTLLQNKRRIQIVIDHSREISNDENGDGDVDYSEGRQRLGRDLRMMQIDGFFRQLGFRFPFRLVYRVVVLESESLAKEDSIGTWEHCKFRST